MQLRRHGLIMGHDPAAMGSMLQIRMCCAVLAPDRDSFWW